MKLKGVFGSFRTLIIREVAAGLWRRELIPSIPFSPARRLLGFWLRSLKAATTTTEEGKGQTRSWLIKAPLPAGGNGMVKTPENYFPHSTTLIRSNNTQSKSVFYISDDQSKSIENRAFRFWMVKFYAISESLHYQGWDYEHA